MYYYQDIAKLQIKILHHELIFSMILLVQSVTYSHSCLLHVNMPFLITYKLNLHYDVKFVEK